MAMNFISILIDPLTFAHGAPFQHTHTHIERGKESERAHKEATLA